MLIAFYVTSILLFIIGIIGYLRNLNGKITDIRLNAHSCVKLILNLELILLGCTLLVLAAAYQFNDLDGQLIALYLIVLAGVESIIGLSLIIQYYSSYNDNFTRS